MKLDESAAAYRALESLEKEISRMRDEAGAMCDKSSLRDYYFTGKADAFEDVLCLVRTGKKNL